MDEEERNCTRPLTKFLTPTEIYPDLRYSPREIDFSVFQRIHSNPLRNLTISELQSFLLEKIDSCLTIPLNRPIKPRRANRFEKRDMKAILALLKGEKVSKICKKLKIGLKKLKEFKDGVEEGTVTIGRKSRSYHESSVIEEIDRIASEHNPMSLSARAVRSMVIENLDYGKKLNPKFVCNTLRHAGYTFKHSRIFKP